MIFFDPSIGVRAVAATTSCPVRVRLPLYRVAGSFIGCINCGSTSLWKVSLCKFNISTCEKLSLHPGWSHAYTVGGVTGVITLLFGAVMLDFIVVTLVVSLCTLLLPAAVLLF